MPTTLTPRRQALFLAAITIAFFLPTLFGEFVYDARQQIASDGFIHDRRNWLNVLSLRVVSMDVLDFNRPVHLASLMIDAALWGREPFGYHLTSVLLHAVNVVLVWAILRRLGNVDNWPSCLGALVFAVHPIVTEAVCEPTFREDLLATAFSLTALVVAMSHRATAVGLDCWRALVCTACCFLAVGSKESGSAAPLLVAVYWWLFRRGEPDGFWRLAIGGGVGAIAAFLAARFLLEPAHSAIFDTKPGYPGGSFANAMLLQPRILALYVQNLVWPIDLCAEYGLPSIRYLPLPVAAVILGLSAVGAVVTVRADRRTLLPFAVVVMPLVPVSNIVPIYNPAADRYLYMSMAGIAMILGLFLGSAWLQAERRRREMATSLVMVVIACLGFFCIQRQQVWRTSLALWEDTVRKIPISYTAMSGYGDALYGAGRLTEAEKAAREAIRLSEETRGDPWVTLALILDAQGRTSEARKAVEKSLELDPALAAPGQRVRTLALERSTSEVWGWVLERPLP